MKGHLKDGDQNDADVTDTDLTGGSAPMDSVSGTPEPSTSEKER